MNLRLIVVKNALAIVTVRIERPRDGTVFFRDALFPDATQAVALVARGADAADVLQWSIDGQPLGTATSGERVLWPLAEGQHRLAVRALRGGQAHVDVTVQPAGVAAR